MAVNKKANRNRIRRGLTMEASIYVQKFGLTLGEAGLYHLRLFYQSNFINLISLLNNKGGQKPPLLFRGTFKNNNKDLAADERRSTLILLVCYQSYLPSCRCRTIITASQENARCFAPKTGAQHDKA